MPCPSVSGKKYLVANVPPERFQNQETASGTQGRSGLVRSALEKLSLFSPTFPVRQKHGAGISPSADGDSEGYSPSKNTSPAALSWSSLFGDSFSESFCFCTMVFVTALAILRDTACRVRRFHRIVPCPPVCHDHSRKKKHPHRSESAFLVVPCTMAILRLPASPVQRLPLVR